MQEALFCWREKSQCNVMKSFFCLNIAKYRMLKVHSSFIIVHLLHSMFSFLSCIMSLRFFSSCAALQTFRDSVRVGWKLCSIYLILVSLQNTTSCTLIFRSGFYWRWWNFPEHLKIWVEWNIISAALWCFYGGLIFLCFVAQFKCTASAHVWKFTQIIFFCEKKVWRVIEVHSCEAIKFSLKVITKVANRIY